MSLLDGLVVRPESKDDAAFCMRGARPVPVGRAGVCGGSVRECVYDTLRALVLLAVVVTGAS